jgi:predicted nucleic acid-binding protein
VTYYFLDSSALIKRYHDESGSTWVRNLFDDPVEDTFLLAQITPVEFYSGVMRRMREGTIHMADANRLRRALAIQLKDQYRVVLLTTEIINRSQELLERYPLRAYDAVQLASAYTTNRRLIATDLAPLVFVSADKRLNQAAATEGLLTDDPNAHP